MSEKTTGKLPPQDLEAEMSLLGAVLLDEEVLADVVNKVRPGDFYDPRHEKIYSAMLRLYEKSSPVDLLTLTNELKSGKILDEVGGKAYVTELTNYVPTAAHAAAYADMITAAASRRRLIKVGTSLAEMGYDTKQSVEDLLQQAESGLYNIDNLKKGELTSIEAILASTFDRIEELHRNPDKLRGVKTGYPDVDRMTAGLQKSDLIILAARPAMGKSTFAQNLAYNIATKENKAVLFFSLEMSQDQLVERMLSEAAGVDNTNIRTGRLQGEDFTKISDAMGELAEAPIYFDDTPGMSVLEMRTKARRQAHKTPLGLIIVDYLQLMSGSSQRGSDNRVQEVSEISRGLKLLARELDVPVLALSQLSRSVESRNPQIPMLSDLRESGSIEQDADVVMFLYREDYYDPDTERQHITELIISKHRNGPTGKVELYFHPEQLKFMSLNKKAK
ncbi:replicative DNA helicase [Alphaproteobacteria bacterium]|nr:replicative DNA helicase [Alphaproteobacteria bacterium]